MRLGVMVAKPSLSYLLKGKNTWTIKPKDGAKKTTNPENQIWDVYEQEKGQTEDMSSHGSEQLSSTTDECVGVQPYSNVRSLI